MSKLLLLFSAILFIMMPPAYGINITGILVESEISFYDLSNINYAYTNEKGSNGLHIFQEYDRLGCGLQIQNGHNDNKTENTILVWNKKHSLEEGRFYNISCFYPYDIVNNQLKLFVNGVDVGHDYYIKKPYEQKDFDKVLLPADSMRPMNGYHQARHGGNSSIKYFKFYKNYTLSLETNKLLFVNVSLLEVVEDYFRAERQSKIEERFRQALISGFMTLIFLCILPIFVLAIILRKILKKLRARRKK